MTLVRTSLRLAAVAAAAASLALASAASAQPAKKTEFGQDAPPQPGFEPKSKSVPAGDGAPSSVNLGAQSIDRAAKIIYFRYKGVDLPLKRFVEYEGSAPFVQIVDGNDVLWVARRADLNRMMDRVLYAQLDTMTGAADDLFTSQRFPSAFNAYQDVLSVLSSEQNDLASSDLEHYPAVRSYLQLRMGQSRSWGGHQRWLDSETAYRRSEEARERAARLAEDPYQPKELVDVWLEFAGESVAEAEEAAADGARLMEEARVLLESAASRNERLWQAHNELGILAAARADRAAAEGRVQDTEKELEAAKELFRKARARTDAKELVDGNLIAIYSSLADIEHGRAQYGKALDLIRDAMEFAPEFATATADADGKVQTSTYEVAFTRFHPTRGEKIVVTADLAAGLASKYLAIERDRRNAARTPLVVEGEAGIPALWRKQGEELIKKKRWRSAVGFYTALYDEYRLSDATAAVEPDFRSHVTKSLERAFGERAAVLLAAEREEDALVLYALALNYIPNSRVLNQAHVAQAFRRADAALAGAHWEEAIRQLRIVEKIYADYSGKDAEAQKTKAGIANRFGAAYVGLTRSALDRGDVNKAGEWADLALHLTPPLADWKENKGKVLFETAKQAEKAGDLEGAFALYEQARRVAVRGVKVRAAFSRDTVRAQLLLPKAKRKIVAATRDYGLILMLGVLAMVVGVPATRGYLTTSSRRRRSRSLRNAAQAAFDAKKWNEAVDLFNDYFGSSSAVGSADPQAYELVARAYRKLGDYENALRYFERASARMPGRRFNLERAEIYLMRRNLPLAVQALRTSPALAEDAARLVHFLNYLREKDGESLFVTEALAQVQITAGDFEAGRQLYLRLLDLEPRSPRTLRALAEIARRSGQAGERRSYLERLVLVDTSDAVSLRELGNLMAADGPLQPAIDHLKRALELSPGEGLAARIAELQAELLVREAETEIDRLGREQDTPNRRFRIGELHWKLGRGREAKVYFEEAATVKEYQARSLRYLGLIAWAEGDAQDAISLLRGYLAKRTNLAPDTAEKEARYTLGEAYEKVGNAEHASAQYEAIFESDPGYKDVAKKVKQRMASGFKAKGPVDCPFCKRRVPGDAEFCPHCNYHLATGSAGRFGGTTTEGTPTSTLETTPKRSLGLDELLGDDSGNDEPGDDE